MTQEKMHKAAKALKARTVTKAVPKAWLLRLRRKLSAVR